MAISRLLLASIVVVAFLGIGSADYQAGRSLKPYQYQPNNEGYGYKAGRSLKPYPYQPNHEGYGYKAGRSLKPYPYQPYHEGYGYKAGRSLKPYPYQPNNVGYMAGRSLKPYKPQEKYPSYQISGATKIQGLIFCKRDGHNIKMQGATARVTCEVKDKNGYNSAPFSVITPATDAKGYFLINLGKYTAPGYDFINCKVFLNQPAPGAYCDQPTNAGSGLSGATPSKPRILYSDNSILYSVGPFVYLPSSY